MPKTLITLHCQDFEGLGGCCGNCHSDWEDGYDSPIESVPDFELFLQPRAEALLCCSMAQKVNGERALFAKAIKKRRKESAARN